MAVPADAAGGDAPFTLVARTDERTTLPNGAAGPYRKYSGAERPAVA